MNKSFPIIIGLLIAFSGFAKAAKIAAVDIQRINENYSLIKEANTAVTETEIRVKKLLGTAEAELKALETEGKKEELEKKRATIQELIDNEVENLQDEKEFYSTEINHSVNKALEIIAKEVGYSLIIERGYVISDNVEDITNSLITKLESLRSKTTVKPNTGSLEEK